MHITTSCHNNNNRKRNNNNNNNNSDNNNDNNNAYNNANNNSNNNNNNSSNNNKIFSVLHPVPHATTANQIFSNPNLNHYKNMKTTIIPRTNIRPIHNHSDLQHLQGPQGDSAKT